MGLPCPALAARCAAAYLCELPPEPFPQLRGAAGGNRASGCLAAENALCGPAQGAKGGPVLAGRLKWILNFECVKLRGLCEPACIISPAHRRGFSLRRSLFSFFTRAQRVFTKVRRSFPYGCHCLRLCSMGNEIRALPGRNPALRAGRYRHLVPSISAPTERTGWLPPPSSEGRPQRGGRGRFQPWAGAR